MTLKNQQTNKWRHFLLVLAKKVILLFDREVYYDNFGVFYNNTLSYLFTNPERDVVKHNIDNPLDVPRHLPDTRIPNQHIGSVITGVQVGHYFWIFGGFKWQQHGPKILLSFFLFLADFITLLHQILSYQIL